jgi:phage tail protein X
MDLSTLLPWIGHALLGGGASERSQGTGVTPSKLGGGSATPEAAPISPSGAFPDATDPGSTARTPSGDPGGALAWLSHVLQMNQGIADTTGVNPLALGLGVPQPSPVSSADAAMAAPQRGIALHDLFGARQPVSWLPPMHVDLGVNPIPIGRDQTDPLAWMRVYGRW